MQQFQGTGSQVSPPATFTAGLATFRLTHTGARNFIVDLVDAEARRVTTLISAIGAHDGGTVAQVPAGGNYTLNVIADGAWTIAVGQPTAAELAAAPPLPQTFGGRGGGYAPFVVERGGMLHLKLAHNGKRDFIVRVIDAQGRLIDLPANGKGALNGAKNVDLPAAGTYILVVDAADEWSVELRQQGR